MGFNSGFKGLMLCTTDNRAKEKTQTSPELMQEFVVRRWMRSKRRDVKIWWVWVELGNFKNIRESDRILQNPSLTYPSITQMKSVGEWQYDVDDDRKGELLFLLLFIYFQLHTAAFKGYCTIWVRRFNFRHQASRRVSPRQSTQRRKVELWARKCPVILPKCQCYI
jgi:hypothetical protein